MLSRTRRARQRRSFAPEALESRTLLSGQTGSFAEALFTTSYASLQLRPALRAQTQPRAEHSHAARGTTSVAPQGLALVQQSTPPTFLQSLNVVSNADGTSAAIIDYQSAELGTYTATARWDNGPAEPVLIDQPGEFWHEPTVGSAYALRRGLGAAQHTLELTVTNADRHVSAITSTVFSIESVTSDEGTPAQPYGPDTTLTTDNMAAPEGFAAEAQTNSTGQVGWGAPTINAVFVSGSTWSSAFKSYLQTNAPGGDASYGYAIPAGADQLKTLTWTNVDTVSVRFSENVTVGQADLAVHGAKNAEYGIASFTYDPTTFTATWRLSQALPADNVLLNVSRYVTDGDGRQLDGEWADGNKLFPSGDTAPDGAFAFTFNMLPGDVNYDGAVNDIDKADVRARFFSSTAAPGTDPATAYTPFHDVDGTGDILASDYSATGVRAGTTRPATDPIPLLVPDVVTGLTATGGTARVDLSWTASAGASSYNVYRVDGDALVIGSPYQTKVTGTIFADTGLAPGAQHTYAVTAVNGAGEIGIGETLVARAMPATPASLSAAADTRQIRLTWAQTPGADTYNVYRVATGTPMGGSPYRTGLTTTTLLDAVLGDDAGYTYAVSASNDTGESPLSPLASARTPAAPAPGSPPLPPPAQPAAPPSLSAKIVSDTDVILSWQDASDSETGYAIEKLNGTTITYVYQTPPNARQWPVVMDPGETATFRVRQLNGTATSPAVTVTTPPGAQGAEPKTDDGVIPGWSGGVQAWWYRWGTTPAEGYFDPRYGTYMGKYSGAATYHSRRLTRHTEITGSFNMWAFNFWQGNTVRVLAKVSEEQGFQEVYSGSYSLPDEGHSVDEVDHWLDDPATDWDDYAWRGGDNWFPVSFSFPHALDTLELRVEVDGLTSDQRFGVAEFGFSTFKPAAVGVDPIYGANGSEQGPANGSVRFVRAGGDTSKPLQFQFAASGTATPGTDYQPGNGQGGGSGDVFSAEFPAGATVLNLPITVIDDAWQEGSESVALTVLPTRDYGLYYTISGSQTISDNDTTPQPPQDPAVLPEISVVTTDDRAAEPDGTKPADPAEFKLHRTGSTAAPLDVYYSLSGLRAGVDFDPSQLTAVGGEGQYLAHFNAGQSEKLVRVPPRNNHTADNARVLTLALLQDPTGRSDVSTNQASAQVALNDPAVVSVEFLPKGQGKQSTPDAEARRGTLDDQNPNGAVAAPDLFFGDAPPFEGGWRIFPDAPDFASRNDTGKNIVRVRAKLSIPKKDVKVYFRSFDVDDPTKQQPAIQYRLWDLNHEIDADDNGLDNRGSLGGAGLDRPVRSIEPDADRYWKKGKGFHGRMRAVGMGSFAAENGTVMALSEIGADGNAYAEAELAVSFAPGDNFRVIASTERTQLENLSALEVPTSGDIKRALPHGAASPQLSVWRRLNIEHDTMSPTDANGKIIVGDQLGGEVDDIQQGAPGTLLVTIKGQALGQTDTFAGGKLLFKNEYYHIQGNDLSYVTIELGTKPRPVLGDTVQIFQDEFDSATQLRADVTVDTPLYRRLQPTTDSFQNALAEAYIEPRLDTLNAINPQPKNPGQSHSLPPDFDQYRNSAAPGSETDTFWVVYMSTAFEGPPQITTMQTPWGGVPIEGDGDGPSEQDSSRGYTKDDVSIVYMETALDLKPIGEVSDYYAVVGVHEIGHQLGLAFGKNANPVTFHRRNEVSVMTVTEQESALEALRPFDTIPFNPIDIAWLRTRVHSPSSDPAKQW
jgi:hypothetical protein